MTGCICQDGVVEAFFFRFAIIIILLSYICVYGSWACINPTERIPSIRMLLFYFKGTSNCFVLSLVLLSRSYLCGNDA